MNRLIILFFLIISTRISAQQHKGGWVDVALGVPLGEIYKPGITIGVTACYHQNLNVTIEFSSITATALNISQGYLLHEGIFFTNPKLGVGLAYYRSEQEHDYLDYHFSLNIPMEVEAGIWVGPFQAKLIYAYEVNKWVQGDALMLGIGIGAKPPR